jgi:nucleobase:cation symporter-1, NCS1 family
VSSQNLQPRIPQRAAVAVVGVLGVVLAAWLGNRADLAIGTYESFLLLLGSAFVPLFGVFTAHYFVLRRSAAGAVDRAWPVEWRALAAWVVGFAVYQWSAPTPLEGWSNVVQTVFQDWLGLPFPLWNSVAGASIPSFAAALGSYLVLARVRWRSRTRAKIS